MSDLSIDLATLTSASGSIQGIYNEFDGIGRAEGDLGPYWGSGDIKHAMDDFADNWDYHRHKIMSAMKTLGKNLSDAVTGFQQADQKLKDALTNPKKH